jgi:VanZ family protein
MLRTNRPRPPLGIEPWLLYPLLLVAYLMGIYWLSSLPDLGVRRNPVIRLVSNLFHIPLFAGLAFCLLRALSWREGSQQVTWRLLGLTFLVTAVLAALDEWHQSFVAGRQSNMKDFLLDLLGSGGMLLILRVRARRRARDAAPPGDRPGSCLHPARSATGQ